MAGKTLGEFTMSLTAFFETLAGIFGVLLVGGMVESFLLWMFPSHYPNVLREDAYPEEVEPR